MFILGQRSNSDFKLFTVSAAQHLLWTTIMILHKCIDLDLRRTSIDLGSKDKVIFGL